MATVSVGAHTEAVYAWWLPMLLLLPTWGAVVVIKECPSTCRCLEMGSIMTCRREMLVHVPHLLSTTMMLDLDHNHIGVLTNGSFDAVPRLVMLSLQDNGMLYLEPGVFAPLQELQILRLGRNKLSSLPSDVFMNNRHLEVLDLHGNLFTVLPDNMLYHLHSLTLFNVSYNRLSSPQLKSGFRYTPLLTTLDLSGNQFISLEANAFVAMRAWDENASHYLNLSYCGIQHIHPRALDRLSRLQGLSLEGNALLSHDDLRDALLDLSVSSLHVINLSHMNITNIYEFFRNFQHEDLQELYLSCNHIRTIQRGTFFYLVNLVHLDLSQNQIGNIDDLKGLTKLVNLNLAYNQISYLDPIVFEGLQNLKALDLSHNALVEINDSPFQTLFDLQWLDVSCNSITSFSIEGSLEGLQTLSVHSNRLSNISFLQRLRHLQNLDVSQNAITRIKPNTFSSGHHLLTVNFSGNAIFDISVNAFQQSSIRTLDLSDNQLTSLSHPGWAQIRTLYLHNNKIYNLTANAFRRMESLEELHFAHNQLYGFPRAAFKDLHNLRLLDLSHNPLGTFLVIPDIAHLIELENMHKLTVLQLSHINLYHFPTPLLSNLTALRTLNLSGNHLTRIPADSFSHMNRLRSLDLSDNLVSDPNESLFTSLRKLRMVNLAENPLDCNCDLLSFRSWLLAGKVTVPGIDNASMYQCATPPEWKGVSLAEFHLGSGACSSQEKAVIFTAVGCLILALGLTLTIAVLKYKWWQKRKAVTTMEYSFIDDSSTSALTGTGSVRVNQHSRQWV